MRPARSKSGGGGGGAASVPQPQQLVKGQAAHEPRGRGGGTGVIIGDQPPLDVDALLRRGEDKPSPTEGQPPRILTEAQKMRKVICELVDTEVTYVRHLGFLMKTYLEPLREEGFLTNTEIR